MSDHENLLLKLRQRLPGTAQRNKNWGSLFSTILPVLYLTITELARESGTSEASVTRLCRTLGCKGYNEFKMALALDIQQGLPERQAGDAIDNVVDESVRALQDTAKLIDRAQLEQATLALHQAQSVQIYGVAASAILGSICITSCCDSANLHSCLAICIAPP